MVALLRWWRVAVFAAAAAAAAPVAPRWNLAVFAAFIVFSTLPVLCWLVAAPPSAAALAVGLGLAGLCVVPGVVFGPGGLAMYRVVAGGPQVAVWYLPLGMLVVAVGAPTLAHLASRKAPDDAQRRAAVRRAWIAAPLCMAVGVTNGCGPLGLSVADGEIPALPAATIIGTLPDGLSVLGEPVRDGGSSATGVSYDIIAVDGQPADTIADQVARHIAQITGWPVPAGFAARCYRAAGFTAYSGRFCVTIRPADSRTDAVTVSLSAWDNRFSDFSPTPG